MCLRIYPTEPDLRSRPDLVARGQAGQPRYRSPPPLPSARLPPHRSGSSLTHSGDAENRPGSPITRPAMKRLDSDRDIQPRADAGRGRHTTVFRIGLPAVSTIDICGCCLVPITYSRTRPYQELRTTPGLVMIMSSPVAEGGGGGRGRGEFGTHSSSECTLCSECA